MYVGNLLLQEAAAIGLFCVDDVPSEHKFAGFAPADECGQKVRLHSRGYTHPYLRHSKFAAVSPHSHIACGRKLHAETEAPSVDSRDDRDWEHADRSVRYMRKFMLDRSTISIEVFHFS